MNMKKLQIFKNKKIISAIVSIALVVTAAIGVTAALYQAETDSVVNQFTVGNVTTELVEEFYQNPGSDTDFTKTPKVTNTGANDCLVRIRMNVTPESLLSQKVLDENGNETNYLVISGWPSKWTLKDDGFYYYSDVVKPGKSTEPLFTTVTVNYDKDAEDGASNAWVDFDIILYQEAVQAEVIENGVTITDADRIWASYDKSIE